VAHFKIAGILLDIEGTTSSIAFVYDVMFPYIQTHLLDFLQAHLGREDVHEACDQIARDAGHADYATWLGQLDREQQVAELNKHILSLMQSDVKATGLKSLQGLVWEDGFRSGQLTAHLYPDVEPALRRWHAAGIDIRIYSSGSIHAQKLFFAHTDFGDLLPLFRGHYDTTIGSKKEAVSYQKIAEQYHREPAEILFVSDAYAELEAADQAGMQVVASCRPGNPPLPKDCRFRQIESFAQITIGANLADAANQSR
jgi:enolase-phosphatase E1